MRHAAYFALGLASVLAFASDEKSTTENLFAEAQKREVRTVRDFLALIRDWDTVMIPESSSLQLGPRVLAVSPDHRTSIGFNLRSVDQGSESLEIKEYDSTPGQEQYRFSEIIFEKDFNAAQAERRNAGVVPEPETPLFSSGALYQHDIGSKKDCLECHRGGQLRMNTELAQREFEAIVPSEQLSRMKLFNESRRLNRFHRDFDFKNLADFKAAVNSDLRRYRDGQLPFSIKILARKMARVLESETQAAYGLLALFRGCDNFGAFFYPESEWDRRMNYFRERKAKTPAEASFGNLQWKASAATPEAPVARALALIEKDIVERRTMDDPIVDVTSDTRNDGVLAKLRLYWDPLVPMKKYDGEIDKLGSQFWAPAHSIGGTYDFGPLPGKNADSNALPLYFEEIEKRIREQLAKKGQNPDDMDCRELAKQSYLAVLAKAKAPHPAAKASDH